MGRDIHIDEQYENDMHGEVNVPLLENLLSGYLTDRYGPGVVIIAREDETSYSIEHDDPRMIYLMEVDLPEFIDIDNHQFILGGQVPPHPPLL
jgi:hypothetical protein